MTVPEHISVVYVEDDERLARLTQRYLESHGVVVTLARDGREGLAQTLRMWPDVVLLDLMLPHLDPSPASPGRRRCPRRLTPGVAGA